MTFATPHAGNISGLITSVSKNNVFRIALQALLLLVVPLLLSGWIVGFLSWDLSVPILYGSPGADEVWQIGMIQTILDTGWVLDAPRLGAPGEGHFYNFTASQLAAFHIIPIRIISLFTQDPVAIYNIYVWMSFPLIATSVYISARLLGSAFVFAVCAGILAAFLPYRFNLIWSYSLGVYYVVGPTLVLVCYIAAGKLDVYTEKLGVLLPSLKGTPLRRLFVPIPKSKTLFAIAAALTIISAMGDGYFTFMLFLLIGLAIGLRALSTRPKRWLQTLTGPIGIFLIAVLTYTALITPLEIARDGEPALYLQDDNKQTYEPEIYSDPLKLLFSPIRGHRIKLLDDFTVKLIEDTNFNSKFPTTLAIAPLGLLGTVLFFGMMGWLLMLPTRKTDATDGLDNARVEHLYIWGLSISALAVLMISIRGGFGSYLVFVAPEIRAYQRYPIYISVAAFLFGSLVATIGVRRIKQTAFRTVAYLAAVILSFGAVLDMTAEDTFGLKSEAGRINKTERYVQERDLIETIEGRLALGSMVYIYPYSQYLSNNSYYGWGKFGHYRPYFMSDNLRWSSGANLDTPEDMYHRLLTSYHPRELLDELRRVGFAGIVMDRLVLPEAESRAMATILEEFTDEPPLSNGEGSFLFYTLPETDVLVTYGDELLLVETIVLRPGFDELGMIDDLIDTSVLAEILPDLPLDIEIVLTPETNPGIFRDISGRFRQLGHQPLETFSAQTACDVITVDPSRTGRVQVDLINTGDDALPVNTDYKWPVTLAINEYSADGAIVESTRFKSPVHLDPGETETIDVLFGVEANATRVSIEFLQEGVRWFKEFPENTFCDIAIPSLTPEPAEP
jgi:hypothetical protein